MAEYKGKLLKGLFTKAANVLLSDGVSSVEDVLNYSTTEHVIGKWIDGRDIFEKTIDVGAFPNSTTKNVNHNISNLDFIINKIANGHLSSGVSITLPYVGSSSGATCDVFVNATSVGIVARGGDYSSYSGWVTIQYVKTA